MNENQCGTSIPNVFVPSQKRPDIKVPQFSSHPEPISSGDTSRCWEKGPKPPAKGQGNNGASKAFKDRMGGIPGRSGQRGRGVLALSAGNKDQSLPPFQESTELSNRSCFLDVKSLRK